MLQAHTTTKVPMVDESKLWDLADRIAKSIQERQAKWGALGLSKLLDERRMRYGIPNEAFEEHAVYDRILVWQLEPRHEEGKKTYGDSSIIRPETAKKASVQESCRGVLVSAGLLALDHLRTNGMELGHIVTFVRLSPWRKIVASYEGNEIPLLILRSGDIIASEDLQTNLRSRQARVLWDEGDAARAAGHVFIDESGKRWAPVEPFRDESY